MIELKECGLMIDPRTAQRIIDAATDLGHSKGDLRWRVSMQQRRAIENLLFQTSDLQTLRRECEHGRSESGLLMGVPYVVDKDLGPGSIILDVMAIAHQAAIITGLAVLRLDDPDRGNLNG